MNALIVFFAACVAVASAGLHSGYIHGGYSHGGYAHGGVLQGPGSHAAVVGPDGSQIVSSEHGGTVVSDVVHGYSGHVGVAVPAVHAVHAVHAVPAVHAYGVHGVHGYAHEGQYVPSGLELLHDDGSYRGEHHHAELYDHIY